MLTVAGMRVLVLRLTMASAKRLATLEPKLVLFGHGAPVRDTRKFVEFVEGLPA